MKRLSTPALVKNGFFSLLILSTLLNACNGNQKKPSGTKNIVEKEKPLRTACYEAIDAKDTAYLKLETFNKGKVKGELKFTYRKKPKNEGIVDGEFVGDTLFLNYTFNAGDNKTTTYKNPLAFLKSDEKLTLGVGEIRTYLGRSYLDKKEKIDFEKGRFIFKSVPCK